MLLLGHEGYRARAENPALMPLPTPDEWSFAQRRSEAEHEANWSAFSRFYNVRAELCFLFEAGVLPTGFRARLIVNRLDPCLEPHGVSPIPIFLPARSGRISASLPTPFYNLHLLGQSFGGRRSKTSARASR